MKNDTSHLSVKHHLCASTHTLILRHKHDQIHLSGEQQGQEVWALIERPHGATTLKVEIFIKVSDNYVTPDWICVNVRKKNFQEK